MADLRPEPLEWGRWRLSLEEPLVCGILNRTPDSFSDAGQHLELEAALAHAREMAAAGAQIIDVGGESSRPGARAVCLEDELLRVLPIVDGLAAEHCLSIDTTKAEVARQCLVRGAACINDISGLRFEPALAHVVAEHDAGLVLMHMQGTPRSMQQQPRYQDVLEEVYAFLGRAADQAGAAGVEARRIAVDPGFGFGKSLAHNLALLRGLPRLAQLGYPLYVGLSRKSMLGGLTGRAVDQRLPAGCAAHALCVWLGASILRVHDVAAAVDVVRVVRGVAG